MRLGNLYAHLLPTVKKIAKVNSLKASVLAAGLLMLNLHAAGQAYYQVTNFSGTTNYAGVNVTVTSSGSAGFAPFLPCGSILSTPYYFTTGAGTFTYTFSQAVGAVQIAVNFASSGTAGEEHFTVNGSSYTLTAANMGGIETPNCGDVTPAVISSGDLVNTGDFAGTPNQILYFAGPITSISISNIPVGTNAADFGVYFTPMNYFNTQNFSGTSTAGGNTVTVTSSGTAGFAPFFPCGHISSSPYYFTSGAGSFTYSFSSSVLGAIVPTLFASSGTAGQAHYAVNGSGVTLTASNLGGGVTPNCGDNTLASISGGDLVNTGDFSGTPNENVVLTNAAINSVTISNIPVGTNAENFGFYYAGSSNALSFSASSPQSTNACLSTATSINNWLTATESNSNVTLTWSVVVGPSHGTLSGFPYSTSISGSGTYTPTGLTYTPTTGYTGSDAITIQVTDGVNIVTTNINITVNNPPDVSNFSTSATNVCQGNGSTVTITSTSLAAGTYNVTYNLTGANSATGVIGSVTMASNTGSFVTSSLANSGSTTIQITSITNAAGCSSTVTSGGIAGITVNANPGSIFVPGMVCVGSTMTLTDGTLGGTWTSSNPGIAAVGSGSGTVSGISGGTPTITYTLSSGCFTTTPITVNPTPNGITGSSTVCTGSTTNLTETSVGGSWSSSNPGVASVNSSGVVTGVAAGTVTISYTFAAGPCYATFPMTVNQTPPANTGPSPATVCTGFTITLANTVGGGVWTSSNTTEATVGSSSGVVTGQSAGTPVITYTAPDGCTATTSITVNTTPPAITGANNVCVGASTTLSDGTAGGTWTSSNTLLATVGAGTGVVTGVAVGTPNISYTMPTGCYVIQPMTVNANPAAIGGATFAVCTGSNITLTDATAGGTWSSSNPALGSVVPGTGVVTGIAAGTPTISYTMGTSCYATQQITVNTTPNAITGSNTVCIGATTILSSTTGGGTWTSAAPSIATVGSGSGVVTGVAVGNTTITYMMASGCYVTTTMTVNSNPAAIGGTFTVCTGTTTTLNDATAGGTWSSSNPALGSVVPGTGVVTGISAGNPVISYTLGTGCYATQVITVNTSPAAIGGPTTVCVGSTITLTDATSGGSWSSSSPALATVGAGTGTVTGVATGVPTITYTATNGCIATQAITVNPVPASIVGSSTVCTGFTTVLTDATPSGTWSSSDGTKATIGAGTGTVTGVAAGTPVMSYTLATGCYATFPMTVNASPVAITGTNSVCVGFTTTLSDGTGGGTWSSSNSSLATVGAGTGIVTGVATGVPTISYVITATGCYATTPVTVNSNPAAIGGSPVVCVGQTTTLTDATSGGTWTSNDVTKATIGAGSGLMTGVAAGNPNISYTLATGCYSFVTATINPLPSGITGTTSVCIGATTTLSDATPSGTWSSSNPAIATVGAGSGTVTGVAQGVATITYVITATGCYTTTSVTVNPNPASITGTAAVCVGSTTPLFDATSGGTWTSSNTGFATVGAGSGVVAGVAAGIPNITYTLPTGCLTTIPVTVNALPAAITGTMNVCVGLTTTLSDATPSGTWSSSNPGEATVVAGTGVVTGVAAGVPTISYVVTATGCYATAPVTVNANPTAITGTASVCTGSTTTLASTPSGGTWTSGNTAWATVNSTSGVVTGVSAAGNPTITYMLSTGCIATKVVTVNQTPVAIAGTASVCVGTTTTLTDATVGGNWSSSNTVQATIGSASGVATGLAAGTPIISYTIPSTGCYATVPLTVNALPANITGTSTVCTGFTDGLSDATPGGTWSSSNISWATVNSTTGVVTGVATGAPTITYTLTSTGCIATFVVTVNQTPANITGTMTVCTGSTTTLADATPSGTWSSSNTSEATVVAGTGVVTGVATGSPTISYTMGTGCYATAVVTVNQTPAAITGSNTVCVGNTTTLSDVTTGGTWTSSAPAQATIGSGNGIVTGVAAGTPTISYAMPTGCQVTFPMTVNTTPAAITGTTVVCAGSATTLSDGTAGGTWSSGNTSIATVGSSTGVVTGVAAGVATISYTMATGCFATTSYTVNAVPNISNFTSTVATSPCAGGSSTVTVSSTSLGVGTFTVTYNLSGANSVTGATATLTMGSTNGTFTIPAASLTSTGSTTVTITAISNTSGCNSNPASNNTSTFAVNALPTVYTVTGGGAYCSGGTGVHIYLSNSVGGVNYQLWLGGTAVGSPVAGSFSGLDFGLFTTAGTYTVTATNATTGCTSNMSGSATVSINPLPAQFSVTGGGSFCSSGSGVAVGLSGSSSSPADNYQLYVGGVATGSPVGGTGAAISFGLQTTAGTYTVVATDATTGCTNTMTGSATVVVNPLPATPTGTLFLCPGTTTTLSDATGGGTWSSSTPAVATVGSTTGVVTGVTTGTSNITYTITTTGCTNFATVTVNPNPAAIAGPNNVCVGSAITLTDATGSGNWTSSNTSLATVNIVTGVVTGVANGTPTITYTLSTGCFVTYPITVNTTPAAIGGTASVCAGSTTTLTDATAGGTWTSSNSAVAAVGSTTGVVTGASAGTATITYSLASGCNSTTAFTVNPTPAAIAGSNNVCVGFTTTLTDASTGGNWTSSNSAIASIGAVSGIVTGNASGSVTITYTLPAGCFVTFPFTVNTTPAAITGLSNICVGASTTMNDATAGGTWSSSNPAIATIGSSTGIATGVSAGTWTCTYTLPAGCFVTFAATVNPNPAAITGTASVCVGSTTTLSDGTTGGTWSSSNTSLATVVGGVVTGVNPGTPVISYTLSTGCSATSTVTVNPNPPAITGVGTVCVGATTNLADASGGGTWTSANIAIATVGSSSGVVTGQSAGNVTITYTLPTGCLNTTTVTVNPSPAAITGATFVCVGQTTTLSDATSGGTWTSSNTSLATIGSTGVVTGIAVGVPTMTYTLPAGCFSTYPISVNTMPASITGVGTVCTGSTTTLSDATTGGSWSSSNTAIATVGTTGIVTGVAAGNATISYTMPGGCFVTSVVTVNPTPSAIAGSNNVCVGLTTTLTDVTTGGTWSSTAPGVASIGTSGVVTGVAVGTATISYTMATGCFVTLPFTVNPLPASITGVTTICQGLTSTLSDASAGGSWTSSNTAVATIGSGTGVVTGVSAGSSTITYTLPTGCIITTGFTVNPLPTVYTVTGGGAYCAGGTGATVGLSNSQSGVNYQLYVGGVSTGFPVAGTGSAISFGLQTTAGTYTVVATNATTGCVANMTGTATVTINLLPTVYNLTGGGGYCSGGTGVVVGLNNSQSGITYQLYNGTAAVGSPVAGTGSAISFGLQTGAGTYTVIATNAVTGCSATMAGSAVVTINPNPTAFTVTGGGAYCSGGTGVTVGLSNSQLGVNYTVTNGIVSSTIPGTGSALSFGTFTSAGTYTVSAINATTGCTNNMTGSATITINALPTVYTVTGGGAYCAGGSGVAVGLSNSQSGVSYQLLLGGSAIGTPVAGTGSSISFGLQTAAGTYTVLATNTATGCTSTTTSSVTITINPLPTATYIVTGGGAYCTGGAGVTIGLNGSTSGINYTLYFGTAPQTTMAGTGSAITFPGTWTTAGSYTVQATNPLTGCTSTMVGTAVVVVNPLPNLYSVTGGGSYCAGGAGLAIGLTNSDLGVNYQLMMGGSTVGTPVAGTGAAISFGTFTLAGTYTVVATNTTTGCSATMSSSAVITINPLPTAFNVTGGGSYCFGGSGVHVGLSGSLVGFSYQLMLGGVPSGIPVLGSGSPIDFGSVTTAGTYTAVATNIATGCTNTMTGIAVVSISSLPAVNNVTGGGAYCAGGAGVPVGLDGSVTGNNYQLYMGGTMIGSAVAGTGSAFNFGTFTPAGTYTVTATNTITGCTSNMNGSAVITINPLPTMYTVTGGGGYCTGGTGVNVGLSSSDLGVSYQLMLGGSALGAPIAGTGSAISFGLQTGAGSYTVVATNGTTSCSNTMSGSVVITINPLPAAFTVTGGGNYCPGGTGVVIGLSGSAAGVNYQLYLGTTPVGAPVAGTGVAISFGSQTAVGTYTVVAIDASTTCTNTMTGTAVVALSPLPTVYHITGGGGYCAGGTGSVIGLSGSTTGVNYQLYLGASPVGIPMAGTGLALNFGLHTVTGVYTIVATSATTGCSTNMSGADTISLNPLPTAFTVTGGGGYCSGGTGVAVGLSSSTVSVSYQLMQGGVPVGSPLAGTGGAISFGLQTVAGTYTVVATNSITGCVNNMTGSATVMINSLPIVYTVTGGGSYCAGGSGVHVMLSTSDMGINYQLYNGTTPVGSPVAGTGSTLDFGALTAAGTYTVKATNAVTGCVNNMASSATIAINPLPAVYTVTGGGGYCAGGAGVIVGLSGSNSGINYQLYNGGTAVGSAVAGTGSSISFGAQTNAGTYTVVAMNASTGCTMNMTGSVVVVVNPLPTIDTVTGGGSFCPGGSGVHVGLSSSTIGVNYQLMRGTTLVGSPLAGTGSGLDYGAQTITGTYFVTATNPTTGCSSNMEGSTIVSISLLPTAFTLGASSSGYCAGGTGVDVTLGGSSIGVNYQLYRGTFALGSAVSGTGFPIDFGMQTSAGTYSVIATSTSTGCVNTMTGTPTISINPLPTVYTVSGGGTLCAGGTGVSIILSGSDMGVNYQVYNGSTLVGTPTPGTGYSLNFGPYTAAGVYTVVATNGTTGCTNNMLSSATITVNPLPTVYFVTGGGSYCAGGTGVYIGLNASDTGINYQLYNGTTAVGTPVAGTGIALNFGPQTLGGSYTVKAINASTGCTSNMSGSAVVAVNSLPALYTVVGGGNVCAGGTGVHIGLSGSAASGVTYQLYNGGPVGTAIAGTGAAIDFGILTTPGTYTVVATNTATGCTNTMTGSALITVSPLPTAYTVTGGGSYCASAPGANVGISMTDMGINYQLYNGGTTVGGLIGGTGAALNFGLEPVGTYRVVAINASTGCTSNMTDSVVVTVIPTVTPAVSITTGVGDTVCAGSMVTFTALTTNGGSSPTFQWSVNGIPSGATSSTYSYTPTDGNVVSVIMTSNATCVSPATATGTIAMTVKANVTPSVTISATPGTTVCQGTAVTFTASPVYGGSAPSYTWQVNGVFAGAGSTFAYGPADGDVVFATMTSSYACVTSSAPVLSNNISMSVDDNNMPVVTINMTSGANVGAMVENDTLTATVADGGHSPMYQWYVNGTPIPGATSAIYIAASLKNGDVVTCQVTKINSCGSIIGTGMTVILSTNVGVQPITATVGDINLVPNPNKGIFTLKGSLGTVTDEEVTVDVTDMLGQTVYSTKLIARGGKLDETIKMENKPANGMYMLTVRSGAESKVFHMVIEQ